jgi:hypothetical protein
MSVIKNVKKEIITPKKNGIVGREPSVQTIQISMVL